MSVSDVLIGTQSFPENNNKELNKRSWNLKLIYK